MRQIPEILLDMIWLSITQTANEPLISNLKSILNMHAFMKQRYVKAFILHILHVDQRLNKFECFSPSYSAVSLISFLGLFYKARVEVSKLWIFLPMNSMQSG